MSTTLADLELERAALRTCILEGERWLLGSELTDAHFTTPRHKALWAAMVQLAADGETIDTVNVLTQLQERKLLQLAGGDEYVLALTDSVETCRAKQLKRLRDLHRLRELKARAAAVMVACDAGDVGSTVEAVAELGTAASEMVPTKRAYAASDLATLVMEHMTAPPEKVRSLYPGTGEMQAALGFLPEGSMIVVGADTNVGKSSFAILMMQGLAVRGVPVGYVSVEDGALLVGTRMVALESGGAVSSRKLLQRKTDPHEQAITSEACGRLHDRPIYVEEAIGATDVEVLMAMARLRARGCRLVVVDYVQAIEASGRNQDRRNEVRTVAKRLKRQAARLGMVLVLVSQLRRPETDNSEPSKHHLKEAGDLENAAEAIVLLWRTEEADAAPVHAKVAKGKWGGVGYRWQMRRDASGSLQEGRWDD